MILAVIYVNILRLNMIFLYINILCVVIIQRASIDYEVNQGIIN